MVKAAFFFVPQAPGYEIVQGALTDVPVLTAEERDALIGAAGALTEVLPPEPVEPVISEIASQGRPGGDYNLRGDVHRLLRQHGWQLARRDVAGEYWRRPGKATGWSASMQNGLFYLISTNAEPFEPERSYWPFSLYALLEHDGDFSARASALRQEGFGLTGVHPDVDLSRLMLPAPSQGMPPEVIHPDPGPIPAELLNPRIDAAAIR